MLSRDIVSHASKYELRTSIKILIPLCKTGIARPPKVLPCIEQFNSSSLQNSLQHTGNTILSLNWKFLPWRELRTGLPYLLPTSLNQLHHSALA